MSDTKRLKTLLSQHLEQAVASYEKLLETENWSDSKGCAAFHSACKAALTHIALLSKMTGEEPQKETIPDLSKWLEQVKNAPDLQEDFDVEFD